MTTLPTIQQMQRAYRRSDTSYDGIFYLGVRTTGIFVRKTLEDFSLPEDCLGPPVRRVLLYAPSGREMVLESPRDEFRMGRMGKLYVRRLEACLRAGVRWRPGTRYLRAEVFRRGSLVLLERAGRASWAVASTLRISSTR